MQEYSETLLKHIQSEYERVAKEVNDPNTPTDGVKLGYMWALEDMAHYVTQREIKAHVQNHELFKRMEKYTKNQLELVETMAKISSGDKLQNLIGFRAAYCDMYAELKQAMDDISGGKNESS